MQDTVYLQAPQVYDQPGAEYKGQARQFQGIPSVAASRQGRLWATWYAGKTPGEDHNNYVVLVTSGDQGESWSEEVLAIDPDGEGPVRAFDPEVWLDPTGTLWLFWAQGLAQDKKGTLSGVWAVCTDQPDDPQPVWSAPRRLCDGVMMCKPIVLSKGEWALPVSTWHQAEHSAQMVVSADAGHSWKLRGACNVPVDVRSHDEHMLVERRCGQLWMLIRTSYGIGESMSDDQGFTWSPLQPSAIKHTSSRFYVRRLQSGNLILVKNGPLWEDVGRSQLMAFISQDDGQSWSDGLLLDSRGQVSYPDGDQGTDGTIYIVYDYQRTGAREILMARLQEEDVLQSQVVSPMSQLQVLLSRGGNGA